MQPWKLYLHCVQVCARSPQTDVYDSQQLHLHLVIIKMGQELTKKIKSTIMLISKWIIYWSFIDRQQLRTYLCSSWCNLRAYSSQIFTLSSLGFSESLDNFAMSIPCHSDHYLHVCRKFEHQLLSHKSKIWWINNDIHSIILQSLAS